MERKIHQSWGKIRIIILLVLPFILCFSNFKEDKRPIIDFNISFMEINYYNESIWYPEYLDLDSVDFSVKYEVEITALDKNINLNRELKEFDLFAINKGKIYYPIIEKNIDYGVITVGDKPKTLRLKFEFPTTYKLSEVVDNKNKIASDIYDNFTLMYVYCKKPYVVKKTSNSTFIFNEIIKEK